MVLTRTTRIFCTATAGAVLGCTFLFQLWLSTLPVDYLLPLALNDDTFYYLQMAHRVAHGDGFSFDGIHRSNGFQPAWQVMLAGVAFVSSDKLALLRNTLFLAATLNLVSGALVYMISRRLLRDAFTLVPVVMWASIQCMPKLSMSGMETHLNWMVFAAALYFLLGMAQQEGTATRRGRSAARVLMAGFLAGALFLARVDNLAASIAFIGLAGWLLLPPAQAHQRGAGRTGSWAVSILAIGSVAATVVLPYLCWNAAYFDALLPVSGTIKRIRNYREVIAPLGGYFTLDAVCYTLTRASEKILWVLAHSASVLSFGRPFWLSGPLTVVTVSGTLVMSLGAAVGLRHVAAGTRPALSDVALVVQRSSLLLVWFWALYGALNLIALDVVRQGAKVALIIAAAGTIVAISGTRTPPPRSSLARSEIVLIFFCLVCLAHAVVLVLLLDYYLDYTSWYFASWFVVFVLMIGWAAQRAVDGIPASRLRHLAGVSLAAWIMAGSLLAAHEALSAARTPPNRRDNLIGMYEQARWIASNTPEDVLVASYNAGVIGYFSQRQTINLDGLMNNKGVIPFIFGPRTMMEYLDLQCVDILADYVTGPYSVEQILAGATVLGVERQRLSLLQVTLAKGWEGAPEAHFLFSVIRDRQCSRPTLR